MTQSATKVRAAGGAGPGGAGRCDSASSGYRSDGRVGPKGAAGNLVVGPVSEPR